jgi:hypothetical protein
VTLGSRQTRNGRVDIVEQICERSERKLRFGVTRTGGEDTQPPFPGRPDPASQSSSNLADARTTRARAP